ncbi:MAG: hypothetical protein GY777_18125 [Candidatus Brocadiaceae bacterium]|nr:hypothetical protein [Candidatus Brocadiaceae bacterium]
MNNTIRFMLLSVVVLVFGFVQGCASHQYHSIETVPFKERSKTKVDGNVKVTIAVLTTKEGKQVYGVDLSLRGIQAVWVEVENKDDYAYWLLSSALDPEYYSPDEVAYAGHIPFAGKYNKKVDTHFKALAFENPILPNTTESGFTLIHLDEGAREVDIDLIGHNSVKKFTYFVPVPGIHATDIYEAESRLSESEKTVVDEEGLREALEQLPCCTTSKDGKVPGDPLNIAVIGVPDDLFPAFIRRGWHMAEDTYWGSIKKTINSFLFGKRYRYSPVSPLYLFGRKQDIALQKARGTIHRRNHLRLWLTPLLFNNKEVWIGQISRDIGVRFTRKSHNFVTHKIDPDVDEVRNAFMEDMLYSQGLEKVGFVKGLGVATKEKPRTNMTGDPYFHDGLRAVLLFDRRPTQITDLKFLHWDTPYRKEYRHLDTRN